MNFLPDFSSSDEDGFSDDNDYQEFKQKMRARQKEINYNNENEKIDPEIQLCNKIYHDISYNNPESVITELDKGFNIDTNLKNGWTSLLLSASLGNPIIVADLLKRGANVNSSMEGTTVLMLACDLRPNDSVEKRLQTIELLIENGADINAFDRKRRTPLMLAANSGNLEAVKYLLPLCDRNAEDNQHWNALFWAVDGNQLEVVEYLLKEKFDWKKTDIRGQTIKNIAENNGFYEIVDIVPVEENNELDLLLVNNSTNFEQIFLNLKRNERPQFFPDICRILYSVKTENLVSKFLEKNISLGDFLSYNESQLKNIGVQMPFQRKRIMSGLYNFHSRHFRPQSMPFVDKKEVYSNIDVSRTVLSVIKQIIVMESSLKFIINNYKNDIRASELKEIFETLNIIKKKIRKLKVIVFKLEEKTKIWDSVLEPADLITKKRQNIPWCNLMTASFFVVTFVAYKYFKK